LKKFRGKEIEKLPKVSRRLKSGLSLKSIDGLQDWGASVTRDSFGRMRLIGEGHIATVVSVRLSILCIASVWKVTSQSQSSSAATKTTNGIETSL
jgi:hypothetical protein